MVPYASITHEKPIVLIPLTIIIFLKGIKDLYEDLKRFKNDKYENNLKTRFWDGQLIDTEWKNLQQGMIIQVKRDEIIPADSLLLVSSDFLQHQAYVETKNLDGETNFKQKKILHLNDLPNAENIQQYLEKLKSLKIEFSEENQHFFVFTCQLNINEDTYYGNEKNLLLRGCHLKNVDYVYALVMFTGHKTKIMLNSVKSKGKKSTIEKKGFLLVIFCLGLMICLSAFATIYYLITIKTFSKFYQKSNIFIILLQQFGNWLLILGNFIPISLPLTIEFIKFFQAQFMTFDKDLQYQLKDRTIQCTVLNSGLNEDLGCVNIIFSDKTGTITQNEMKFHSLINEDQLIEFQDENLEEKFKKNELMQKNIECMNICHSIEFDHQSKPFSFSEEELAILKFTKKGMNYFDSYEKKIDQNQVTQYFIINNGNQQYKYQHLDTIEFSSNRKRMSVIVRNENGKILMFTKGADDILQGFLQENEIEKMISLTTKINEQTNKGLRVMLLVYKEIKEEQWNEILKQKEILQKKNDKQKIQILLEKLEFDFQLLGAVFLEDKLQDGVKDTLQYLNQSGIKTWMITGDKTETAISVSRNCGLIQQNYEVIELNQENLQIFQKNIVQEFSLICPGKILRKILKFPKNIQQEIVEQMLKAQSVIFSRSNPKQKQEIVLLVKNYNKKLVTLAIGDGANDVNMITASDVGIGLEGFEGKQAARASDYSIGRFSHLKILLSYYGNEYYRKNSFSVQFCIYKNFLICMPNFWIGFLNFFNGQILYEIYSFQFYNVVYSVAPIILYGIFDQKMTKKQYFEKPQYYYNGLNRKYFGVTKFMILGCSAFLTSMFLAFITLELFEGTNLQNGQHYGFNNMGNMIFMGACLLQNMKILTETYTMFLIQGIFFILSILIFYILWGFYTVMPSNVLYNTYIEMISSHEIYIFLIVIIMLYLLESMSSRILMFIYAKKKQYTILKQLIITIIFFNFLKKILIVFKNLNLAVFYFFCFLNN